MIIANIQHNVRRPKSFMEVVNAVLIRCGRHMTPKALHVPGEDAGA